MPSDIQVTNIKANDGTAALTIADSTGRITVTETNPSITLGSSATFPAGHILQVQGNSTARVTSSGEDSTVVEQAITIQDYSNNDILICATGVTCKNSTGGTGAHFSLYICGGSLGSTTGGVKYPQQLHYLQSAGDEETIGISHWDKAPPSASETYSLYLQAGDSAEVSHMQWTIAVYEIKR